MLMIFVSCLIAAVAAFLIGQRFPTATKIADVLCEGEKKAIRELLSSVQGSWTYVRKSEGFSVISQLTRGPDTISVPHNVEFENGESVLIAYRLHDTDPPCPFYFGGLEDRLTVRRHDRRKFGERDEA